MALHNLYMYAGAVAADALAKPAAPKPSAVAALLMNELHRDMPGLALPRPEVHLVVRFGDAIRGGLDVYALGGLETVRRKLLRSGQRVVMARLQLGAAQAVLGEAAGALVGRVVALEELWGNAASQRLLARCAEARSTSEAGIVLDAAIAERFRARRGASDSTSTQLMLAAAERLTSANVNAVAIDLGVSARHLRRVFHETTGVSPKTFAKLTRFRRALGAARKQSHPNWASIAAAAGYYDQAHLIAEFRAISGVTPRALLGELSAAHAMG